MCYNKNIFKDAKYWGPVAIPHTSSDLYKFSLNGRDYGLALATDIIEFPLRPDGIVEGKVLTIPNLGGYVHAMIVVASSRTGNCLGPIPIIAGAKNIKEFLGMHNVQDAHNPSVWKRGLITEAVPVSLHSIPMLKLLDESIMSDDDVGEIETAASDDDVAGIMAVIKRKFRKVTGFAEYAEFLNSPFMTSYSK